MVKPDQLVYYSAPKSVGFGHQARRKNARMGWSETLSFLEAYTYDVTFGQNPIRLAVVRHESLVDAEVSKEAIEFCIGKLGPGENVDEFKAEWTIPPESIDTAIELALSCDRWCKQRQGPITLSFSYYFHMLDIENDSPPTKLGTIPQSSLGVNIGLFPLRLFLQPSVYIPAVWDSIEFTKYREKIESNSPFRFREQYYRRAVLTKNKKKYKFTKP